MNFDAPTPADGLPAIRDWDWLALRYVSGEMNVDEAGQFEGCLAEEQVAREAVAAAVMLLQAAPLAADDEKMARPAVATTPQVAKANSWRQRLAWAGVGAAASAAVILATTGNHPSRHRADRSTSVAKTTTSDVDSLALTDNLALTWSSLADDDSAQPGDATPDDSSAPSVQSSDSERARSTQEIVNDLAAPGWLMAAVAPEEMPQGDSHENDSDSHLD